MKQLLKPLFLVLLCVWSLSLHADVFKGIVIDAETRQPLSGVTIKAVQSGQGSDNWTITNDYTSDSLGHFVARFQASVITLLVSWIMAMVWKVRIPLIWAQ